MATALRGGWRRAAVRGAAGFTLLEMLVVLALLGLLAGMAAWGRAALVADRQLLRAGHQMLEELKRLQGEAELAGGFTLADGRLVLQRSFMVFDPERHSYRAYRWRDRNGNGVSDTGEAEQLREGHLPPGIEYGWDAGIDRRACSNVEGPPGSAVSFAAPDYPPCNDRPCIKFDQHGFSVIGPGAIYLHRGQASLALTATRPGLFTMCRWDGGRWKE